MTLCPALAGWNELLIASFSHRSIAVKDGILLATGLHVHRNSAHSAGVGAIFDRWGPRVALCCARRLRLWRQQKGPRTKSRVAQRVKCMPAARETRVRSLGR